ncbi:MAG: MBL fold metallo-hydrolase [Verrucomicrobiales bacterium]|nr:MBL fold metallo-hydrolase [Verrucomicrobiales bacterium]
MTTPLIQPLLRDDTLLADIASVRSQTNVLHLWWLGQSGYLLLWNGRFLLLDPYLSDSLTRKYAGTPKEHIRISERVIAPERLEFVDAVTSSHNHTDHLDPDTLKPLVRANPRLVMVCPEANRVTVRERSGLPEDRILGLDAPPVEGESGPGKVPSNFTVAGFEIHAVPAAHENLDRDASGRHIYLGFVIRAGPYTVYHSGDTVLYPGMAGILRTFGITLALLPINGRHPERGVAGNLNGPEAAQLARAIGAGRVIPCHYDLFAFNTASPEPFTATCSLLGQPSTVLRLGERWSAR